MKKLSELYDVQNDTLVKGIKTNSKEVTNGDIFVCTQGVTVDRHDYIDDAIANGAVAIVVSRENIESLVPVIKVPNTNQELSLLCSRFYDHPLDKLKLIGVTGTDGKTTTAMMIQSILGADICGYIGTTGCRCDKFVKETHNTTPDIDKLFEYFNDFVEAGCKYVSMETSSEAFFRGRLTSLNFIASVLTNITGDHLNVHKTFANYLECKSQLFKQTTNDGWCILNIDDNNYSIIKETCNGKVLTYGKSKDASLKILNITYNAGYETVSFDYQGKIYKTTLNLLGDFNIYNLCAALLVGISLKIPLTTLLQRVKDITNIPGRVELLPTTKNFKVILDYAHTPNAIYTLLNYMQHVPHHKIITVSGSAGGREHEKRSMMGKYLLELSDYVIFTMDDPRNEDVNTIIDEMIGENTNHNYCRIIDRKQAIKKALTDAKQDDIVLIIGKGRDNYMAIGNEHLPYNDYDEIIKYI